MYDQNPLLHKLSVDDLARDYQAELDRQKTSGVVRRFAGIVTVLSVVIAAVIVNGSNIV